MSATVAEEHVAPAVFVAPLLVFVPMLLGVKQRGLLEYGTLTSRYTQPFESKWSHGRCCR